jgi:hypothetical protein
MQPAPCQLQPLQTTTPTHLLLLELASDAMEGGLRRQQLLQRGFCLANGIRVVRQLCQHRTEVGWGGAGGRRIGCAWLLLLLLVHILLLLLHLLLLHLLLAVRCACVARWLGRCCVVPQPR